MGYLHERAMKRVIVEPFEVAGSTSKVVEGPFNPNFSSPYGLDVQVAGG